MDISLDHAIDVREKESDGLESGSTNDILNETVEEDQTAMPENGNANQTGSRLQHYQFRNADNNQVTYRVVQVGGDENNQQATLSIVTTNGILNPLSQEENNSNAAPQVAIVSNPFSNNDSGNEGASSTNTGNSNQRFAYFQASGNSTDIPSPTSSGGGGSSAQADPQMLTGAGQFYVMMSPQEMIPATGTQQSRNIIGRTQFPPLKFHRRSEDGSRNTRDDTRRVQHNEVERRRRDKINTWIMKLASIIPDCANDHTKQGQSKGGILAKACDYILDLHAANQQLSDNLKDYEQTQMNFDLCRQQLEEAKHKIDILTQTIKAHGLDVTPQNQQ